MTGADLPTFTDTVRRKEAAFGNLIADAILHEYHDYSPDFAIINGGFIRGNTRYSRGVCDSQHAWSSLGWQVLEVGEQYLSSLRAWTAATVRRKKPPKRHCSASLMHSLLHILSLSLSLASPRRSLESMEKIFKT